MRSSCNPPPPPITAITAHISIPISVTFPTQLTVQLCSLSSGVKHYYRHCTTPTNTAPTRDWTATDPFLPVPSRWDREESHGRQGSFAPSMCNEMLQCQQPINSSVNNTCCVDRKSTLASRCVNTWNSCCANRYMQSTPMLKKKKKSDSLLC